MCHKVQVKWMQSLFSERRCWRSLPCRWPAVTQSMTTRWVCIILHKYKGTYCRMECTVTPFFSPDNSIKTYISLIEAAERSIDLMTPGEYPQPKVGVYRYIAISFFCCWWRICCLWSCSYALCLLRLSTLKLCLAPLSAPNPFIVGSHSSTAQHHEWHVTKPFKC